jgi:hypothetical protein
MCVPLGFGFGLHDRDTGWVRMGWRDYDPETGRFTALDPIGYVILNGDTVNAEWGYFTWEELKTVKHWGMEVELDCKWTVRRFGEVGKG